MDTLIAALDEQFARLNDEAATLAKAMPVEDLFRPGVSGTRSCGHALVRSAAAIERTFGGLTANMWDDPFEWTQPETLTRTDKVLEYLNEVEAMRKRGFDLFTGDDALMKNVMSPSGEICILRLLLDTLTQAAHYLGRAHATAALVRE